MRMIAKFSKAGSAIYTSHLDVQRAFQMWLSRAGMPIRFSQGFNPHPVLSFASALSLGMESRGEYADIATSEDVAVPQFLSAMQQYAPPGFGICAARAVEDAFPSLMGSCRLAIYDIETNDWECRKDSVVSAAKTIMESTSYEAVRQTKSGPKTQDIRPLIESLETNGTTITTTLACSSQATLAPQLLAETVAKIAAAIIPDCMHILRRDLLFATGTGEAAPLL